MGGIYTNNRESFSSTASSVWVDRKDSSDWIAPCDTGVDQKQPTVEYHSHDDSDDHDDEHVVPKKPQGTVRRRISSASETSECDARELWECMLEIQQRYGCYRSVRMEVAISANHGADMMPSKACLDLLNDSLADEELPEEGWRMLEKHLPGLRSGHRKKMGWKFWKKY